MSGIPISWFVIDTAPDGQRPRPTQWVRPISLRIASVTAALIVKALGLDLRTRAAHMPGQMPSVRLMPAFTLTAAG
ncbi:protein of unknown function [Methylorubrum extorquens]|uniref:Uncharacterized protein n=1 Tax=Methylorubrum extorquens TaxID=408 RepID=A0A2N9ANM7_METEX|nr:protein of unknown function [Methylorubrum extorquens]